MANSPNNIAKSYNKYIFKYVCVFRAVETEDC